MTDEEITQKLKQIQKQFEDKVEELDQIYIEDLTGEQACKARALRITNLELALRDLFELMLEGTDLDDS